MRLFFVIAILFFCAAPALAFTRGAISGSSYEWTINYIFKAPDGTLGYTNIKISTGDQIGSQTMACQIDSPCTNAIYDGNGNVTDPGSQIIPTFVQSESDAESLGDIRAAAKEEQWIAEIGQ